MPPKRKAVDAENPNEGSPPAQATAKRQRVSRACDQCRAAREKCDGGRPSCFPCVSQDRPCTYEVSPKKRGVQTGYIRTLELALAWVFDKVPGCEDTLDAFLNHEAGRGQIMLAGKDPGAANRLHKRWRKSRVQKEIERILSGADASQLRADRCSPSDDPSETEGEADRASFSAVRPGTADDPLSYSPVSLNNSYGPIQAEGPPYRNQLMDSGLPTMQPVSAGLLHGPPRTPPRCDFQLRLPSNHWRLLDIYFSYTHCWLPILEKQEIFQTSYLYSPDDALTLAPDSPSTAAHAELWSALALAAFQDAACSRSMPSTANPDPSRALSPAQIYDIARQLIPTEDGPFQIHHTRALLLLGLISLGRESLRSAWILVGLAVRIFLDIGVHNYSTAVRHQQRFHSVFIACFFLDTILSERLGQPPHLKADDMIKALPISENDLDEWQPWVACEGFGQTSNTARQARSPAYCLSTFNQLYEMFKVVSRDLTARDGQARPTEADFCQSNLQRSISSRPPFGPFVLSPELSSSSIPSPYLIRIFFLWAGVVLDSRPDPESSVHLTMDALEQYQSVFGACAAPPFFVSCLSSLAHHRSFDALSQMERARLTSLRDRLASVWSNRDNTHDRVVRNHSLDQAPHTVLYTQSHSHDTPLHHAGSQVPHSTPTPSTFYINTAIPAPPLASASQAYPSLGTPYVFSANPGPESLLSPATTALTQETPNDMDRQMLTTIPAVSQSHPRPLMPPRSSFNGPPLDYDALLDDLASIDCVDSVDMDPQFMANLGFAPGCDLTEILSHDFGAL